MLVAWLLCLRDAWVQRAVRWHCIFLICQRERLLADNNDVRTQPCIWYVVVKNWLCNCSIHVVYMVPPDLSWNTDQGVWHVCKFVYMKLKGPNETNNWDFCTSNWLTFDWCLSVNMHVRTRKMVNYACAEWSQGKLWWKFVAILTCKSFVTHWYRGERLIEPSSSWFPPKFPSG